ncbi:hypothetical protein SO802_031844 [Lithocarpus litseifolius]|uniref:DDE Tnp4 domain-containing protein n=1 Tax=Lithocarpus litseifolius TaxID=425828 RepID=A0AAW2BN13_9ROSI
MSKSHAFQEYDFDDVYFNNVGSSNICEDNDDDWTNSESEREEEADFNLVNPIVEEMYEYMQRHYDKPPMRTSTLTGRAYMDEIIEGNPAKCYEMFCMTPELLEHLVDELARHGYLRDGRGGVNATQAVAMLLYILGHNTRYRCVADRFQNSIETVSRHFRQALRAIHAYAKHLIKPDRNVAGLPKHLQFTYVHAGWEGSANDSRAFEEAISDRKHGFPWPPTGSYYLVDLGLAIGTSFLPPHKSTSYHAQEFRSSSRWPTSKKELYNYRHSSLWMVIERSFGVLKARFHILNLMPNFKQTRERYVIFVCCALHNFICMNNRSDELFRTTRENVGEGSATNSEGNGDTGASTSSVTRRHVLEMSDASKRGMGQFRDNITDAVWDDYVTRGNVR